MSYPAAQTAGDLNVVVVGWNDNTATVQSVKDSAGNTYSLAIGPTTGTGMQQSIYYAANIAGGSNTVTVTFSQAAAYPDVRILEYRGVTSSGCDGGGEREQYGGEQRGGDDDERERVDLWGEHGSRREMRRRGAGSRRGSSRRRTVIWRKTRS